jgi:hypothetical protein
MMKYLKMLGLAVVAAAAVMAIAGAGTAAAEATLCKTTTEPCTSQATALAAHLVEGTHATLTPAGGLVEPITCKESVVEGNVETATTPRGKITKLTFANCGEDVVETIAAGELVGHHDAAHNGTVTAIGFTVRVKSHGLTCNFGTEVKEGLTLTGGSPAKLDATATIPLENGFFCPSSAVWHAEYVVTTPESLYITTGV